MKVVTKTADKKKRKHELLLTFLLAAEENKKRREREMNIRIKELQAWDGNTL